MNLNISFESTKRTEEDRRNQEMRLPGQDSSQSRGNGRFRRLPLGGRLYGGWDSTGLSSVDQRQTAKHFHPIVLQNTEQSEKMEFTGRSKRPHPIRVRRKQIKNTHFLNILKISVFCTEGQVSPDSRKRHWNSKVVWFSKRSSISPAWVAESNNRDGKKMAKCGRMERSQSKPDGGQTIRATLWRQTTSIICQRSFPSRQKGSIPKCNWISTILPMRRRWTRSK